MSGSEFCGPTAWTRGDSKVKKVIANDQIVNIREFTPIAKNVGPSSTLGCEKSTPRCHVTWSINFSKTPQASSNAKVKSL